jgi:hypothetical protein
LDKLSRIIEQDALLFPTEILSPSREAKRWGTKERKISTTVPDNEAAGGVKTGRYAPGEPPGAPKRPIGQLRAVFRGLFCTQESGLSVPRVVPMTNPTRFPMPHLGQTRPSTSPDLVHGKGEETREPGGYSCDVRCISKRVSIRDSGVVSINTAGCSDPMSVRMEDASHGK